MRAIHTSSPSPLTPVASRRGGHRPWAWALVALATAWLTACGGGKSSTTEPPAEPTAARPSTEAESYRFLTQASFGPNATQSAELRRVGYARWIDAQLNTAPTVSHLQLVEASASVMGRTTPNAEDVNFSWWTHAVKDEGAQLRHRVAFALSEIFVVSTQTVDNGRTVASYLDMLTERANGSYRDLLEGVARHPAMGSYLSHLANRKEDGKGRVPDENFAREVMQLFSIGLYELDDSGQPRLVNGKPVETYSAADIKGLARVFTGWSWYIPPGKAGLVWWKCFWRGPECRDPSQDVMPMSAYKEEHAPEVKQFLGVRIDAQNPANPELSLKTALDRLAGHANTAPFISRQLIQRLVTSNPSNAYVSEVTQVFRRTGGNLHEVVKAILLHNEARSPDANQRRTYGKLREPLLRLTHLMRALPHNSISYDTATGLPFMQSVDTSDPRAALGQSPLRSPSVFNFFRPGYTPPQSQIAAAGLVAPEMQITTETSVLGYANVMGTTLQSGWGRWNSGRNRFDMQFDLSPWRSQATSPAGLIDAIATQLTGQVLPAATRTTAINALAALPTGTDAQKLQCVRAAVLLVAVSPGFLVQQ